MHVCIYIDMHTFLCVFACVCMCVCCYKLGLKRIVSLLSRYPDGNTVYVEIFEWLNFRKYGKLKISKEYLRISSLEVLPHYYFETWRQNISKLYFRKWLVIFETFENNFIRKFLYIRYITDILWIVTLSSLYW